MTTFKKLKTGDFFKFNIEDREWYVKVNSSTYKDPNTGRKQKANDVNVDVEYLPPEDKDLREACSGKKKNESDTLTEPGWIDDEPEVDEAQFPDVYGAVDSAANRAKARARDAKKKIRQGIDKLRADKKKDQEKARTDRERAVDRINSKGYDDKIKKQLDKLKDHKEYTNRVSTLNEHLNKKGK